MAKFQRSCDLPHGQTTNRIIGAAFDVHGELGHGFSEIVFRRAMAHALRDTGLSVWEEAPLIVEFRGRRVGTFRADLVVSDAVLVEIKALREIDPFAEAQVLNYLKAAGGGVALLVNFGRSVSVKRFVLGDPNRSLPNLVKAGTNAPSDEGRSD